MRIIIINISYFSYSKK